jgi:hypothetical protein
MITTGGIKTMTYHVKTIDANRNLIYVGYDAPIGFWDLDSLFRRIESRYKHKKGDLNSPWRIVLTSMKNMADKDIVVSIDENYNNWDRRYNPHIKSEPWHGLAWDVLKND